MCCFPGDETDACRCDVAGEARLGVRGHGAIDRIGRCVGLPRPARGARALSLSAVFANITGEKLRRLSTIFRAD